MARALRLIVLFKRAEKGLIDDSLDTSTVSLIRQARSEYDKEDALMGSSTVLQPSAPSIFHKIYYWFLFRFESELSYFVLTMLVSLIPLGLLLYCLSVGALSRLPIVTYTH